MKKLLLVLLTTALIACSSDSEKKSESAPETEKPEAVHWSQNKGIGPVSSVDLSGEVDPELAEHGATIFTEKCSACHKVEKRYIGPSPQGILERRSPEWVMNMILNPEEMVREDPIAKELLMEYNGTPMANQNLSQEEARAVLEYFRTL